jgi:hypothetical protein
MGRPITALTAVWVVAGALQAGVCNAAEGRGENLYETQCTGCHESIVHIREHNQAHSVADIRAFVILRAKELSLNWSAEDIEQVVRYLNDQYYHYDPGDNAQGKHVGSLDGRQSVYR